MPLLTFAPSISPSPGTKRSPEVNLNQADFGDGYTLSSPNGLNHIKQIVDLKWEGLTEAQFIELIGFMEGRGGYRPFYYQPRGFPGPLKWTCMEWGGSDSSPWMFNAKLKQSFTTEV